MYMCTEITLNLFFKEHLFLKEILYQFFPADFRKENAILIFETKDANWMHPCGYVFNT